MEMLAHVVWGDAVQLLWSGLASLKCVSEASVSTETLQRQCGQPSRGCAVLWVAPPSAARACGGSSGRGQSWLLWLLVS